MKYGSQLKRICFLINRVKIKGKCFVYVCVHKIQQFTLGFEVAQTVLTLFSTRVKMSTYANPFIELAPVLDATLQINSCMKTTNKNTHI